MSFCAAFAGFAALALVMPRHARAAGIAVDSMRAQALRGGGWLLLVLSAAALIAAAGWQIGLVEFCAMLTVAGIAAALQLSYPTRHAEMTCVRYIFNAPTTRCSGPFSNR
ncbi:MULTISPECIES: DUF3325 domain-containing protein [Sphingomonadales]|uniref:DUF3325 domain-containing protein n=1 Tax=Sphingomonadales TaxID=204457 RepID=UPI00336BBB7F